MSKRKSILLDGIVVGEFEPTGDYWQDAQAVQDYLKQKGLFKEISTEEAMHGQANSFASVADELYKRDLKNSPYKGSSIAPFVVNAAFSVEIYLKTMHFIHGEKLRGHNLLDLFERFNHECKTIFLSTAHDVRPLYKLEENMSILDCLRSLSTAFEDWRYLYENNKLQVEIQSIRYLMNVAFEACCRTKEKRTADVKK